MGQEVIEAECKILYGEVKGDAESEKFRSRMMINVEEVSTMTVMMVTKGGWLYS
jgi:hypothetical protein